MRMYAPGQRAILLALGLVGLMGCDDAAQVSTTVSLPEKAAVQVLTVAETDSVPSESERPLRIVTPPTALPDKIADQICTFHRYTTEADLIARFGPAKTRDVDGSRISMLWLGPGWRLVAYWASGELQVAGASAEHPEISTGLAALSDYSNELRIGETTQQEVIEQLGEGVQTAVSWHHGIDTDAEAAVRNGVPLRALADHCNRRYTWVQETGDVTTLAFRDGILDGGFDDE